MVSKYFLLWVLALSPFIVSGQIRQSKLIVPANESYDFRGSDIIVIDTLIMMDSSLIILNNSKKDNFIHAKKILIQNACSIIGLGKNGEDGKSGVRGTTQSAPCRVGQDGSNATKGTNGHDGVNLTLYMDDLEIVGALVINLNGGDGGDGGKGGRGGDGGSGTRVCRAGNGGSGGSGANGGAGGNGGSVGIHCRNCDDLHLIMGNKLIIKNFGGFGGIGGEGGFGGRPGLGPAGDGKNGIRGKDGRTAPQGKSGIVNLSRN
ncbi:MAG TPA: hypothetical protein DGG95_08440 [Cytophagales bacterium]|jgi:hypothetical protein|nr:hypothetical protein [Cytophagales bacterium]